jgi:hypothetical protein
LIFFVINPFPLSPVTCSNDSDSAFSDGKADGHDAALYLAETEETIFRFAVIQILNNDATRIGKGVLGFMEGNLVLFEFCVFLKSSHSKSGGFMSQM